jgi:hypothetical protein
MWPSDILGTEIRCSNHILAGLAAFEAYEVCEGLGEDVAWQWPEVECRFWLCVDLRWCLGHGGEYID